MTTPKTPLCATCKHLRDFPPEGEDFGLACDAYPRGIPEEILDSKVDHRKPYSGDQGIRYKKGIREESA